MLEAAAYLEHVQNILAQEKWTQKDIDQLCQNYDLYEQAFLDNFAEKGFFDPKEDKEKIAVLISIFIILHDESLCAAKKFTKKAAQRPVYPFISKGIKGIAMPAIQKAIKNIRWDRTIFDTVCEDRKIARHAADKSASSIFEKVDLSYLAGDPEKLIRVSWSLSKLCVLNWTLTKEAEDLFIKIHNTLLSDLNKDINFEPIQELLVGEKKDDPYILIFRKIFEPLPEKETFELI